MGRLSSGRAVNPSSQHYSPVARDLFEERGVSIKFLPPKGKYFNPLELLFNDLKQHDIRPNFPKNGRPLSKSKIAGLIRGYEDEAASAREREGCCCKKNRLIVLFVQQCANHTFQSAAVLCICICVCTCMCMYVCI